MEGYLIKRVFNNNAVLVEMEQNEYVFIGKGIGFNKKRGSMLPKGIEVENTFIHLDGSNKMQVETLLEQMDEKILTVVGDIVSMAEQRFSEQLHQDIHLALADHIAFAVKRIKEGMSIVNPFMLETKMLYQREYEIAEQSLELLRKKLLVDLPESEIGFIALHIHGARLLSKKGTSLKYVKAVGKVIPYVQDKLDVRIEEDSFAGVRLIAHLRGVIERCEKKQPIENIFLEKLKSEYPFEYKISQNIALILEKNADIIIPESEIGYIALHIYKLNQTR